jgi:hypothetical protein
MSLKTCLTALGVLATVAAIDAAPAGATVAINSFTLTLSTTQAGANPDLTMSATLAPTSGDDPQSVTISLATGLLANPTVPATCSETQLQGNACPAGSQIGSGTVTATALGLPVNAPAKVYLVTAHSDEIGRVGMVVSAGLGTTTAEGPVTIRTQPDVGANVTFANLPQSINGIAVTVTGIQLTLDGTVNGKPFTRNPTSCAPASTGISVSSYGAPSTPATAQSSFTPTGCASLPYGPAVSGTATVAGWDGQTALTSTIAQAAGEAATSQSRLTLPFGLVPRWDVYSRACSASDVSTCPASATVGNATVSTPLSAQPLSGRVVLVSSGGSSTPGVALVFPAPFGIVISGTNSVSSQGFTTTFTHMPDVPMSSVSVALAGGSDSLLKNGYSLCVGKPTLSAGFTAQSGTTSSASGPVAVTGCPA